jgi:hypothetical protein
MAAIKPVIKDVSPNGDESCYQVQWTPVASGDTCNAVSFPKHSDRSIQVSGTFSGGTSIAIQGTNEPAATNFVSLRGPDSVVIAFTAAGMKAVLENALFHAPLSSSGDGSQSVTITMLFHLSNPMRQ